MKQKISSNSTWEDIVGYSRAIKINNIIEIAGTTAMDGDQIIGQNDMYKQTVFILNKIENLLIDLDATLNDVVRTRIYVTDISKWEQVAKAHHKFFKTIKPVSTMIEINKLINSNLLIEIEATAILEN